MGLLQNVATIIVSVSMQMLTLKRPGQADKTWPVSTAAKGTGFEPGSNKTPTGNFRIYRKIGGSEPIYTIFWDRRPVGVWDPTSPPNNKVLTRVMWLDGIDEVNNNTLRRYIFIHGTSNEPHVGTPYSAGCVTMKNADVIELYNLVDENTRVTINP